MNKYEIVGIVGEGAYGIVYKAKNKESGEFGKWKDTVLISDCVCSGDQEVQGEYGWGRDSQEDNDEGGQDAADIEAWKYRGAQGSIQEVRLYDSHYGEGRGSSIWYLNLLTRHCWRYWKGARTA